MAAATARSWARVVDLHVFDLPIAGEPLRLGLAWHRRFDADPAHAWLRGLVREAIDTGPPRRRTS